MYSLRAREHPTVSTPVAWEEVERTFKKKDASLLVFEAADVIKRFEKMGDLHAPVLEIKQKLPDVRVAASSAPRPATVDLAAQAEEAPDQAQEMRTKSAAAGKSKTRSIRRVSTSTRAAPKKASKTAPRKRRAV